MASVLLSTLQSLKKGNIPARTSVRVVSSFTSTGTFVTPLNTWLLSAIVIGGGGGGGETDLDGNTNYRSQGGGGGGGSFTISTFKTYPGANHSVVVGAGGAVNSYGGQSVVYAVNSPNIVARGGGRGGSGFSGGWRLPDFSLNDSTYVYPDENPLGGGGGGGQGASGANGGGAGGPADKYKDGITFGTTTTFSPGWRCGSGGSGSSYSTGGYGGNGGGGLGPPHITTGGPGIVYTFPSWTGVATISASGGGAGGNDYLGAAFAGWCSNCGKGAYWTWVPSVYTGYPATAGAVNTGSGGGGGAYISGSGGGTPGGTNSGTGIAAAAGGSGMVIILGENQCADIPGVAPTNLTLPTGLL